jgi:hypothetical protein
VANWLQRLTGSSPQVPSATRSLGLNTVLHMTLDNTVSTNSNESVIDCLKTLALLWNTNGSPPSEHEFVIGT